MYSFRKYVSMSARRRRFKYLIQELLDLFLQVIWLINPLVCAVVLEILATHTYSKLNLQQQKKRIKKKEKKIHQSLSRIKKSVSFFLIVFLVLLLSNFSNNYRM